MKAAASARRRKPCSATPRALCRSIRGTLPAMAERALSIEWRRLWPRPRAPVVPVIRLVGVIGGGLFCLRAAAGAGGEDEKSSGVGSWNATRGAHGEDMADSGAISCCTCIHSKNYVQLSCHTQRNNTQSQTRE